MVARRLPLGLLQGFAFWPGFRSQGFTVSDFDKLGGLVLGLKGVKAQHSRV